MPPKQKNRKKNIVPPSENTITDKDESITEDLTSMLEDTNDVLSDDDNSFETRIINLEKAIENIQIILEKHEKTLNDIINDKKDNTNFTIKSIDDINRIIEKHEKILNNINNINNINYSDIPKSECKKQINELISIDQFAELQTEFRQFIMSYNNKQEYINERIDDINSKINNIDDSETKKIFKNKSEKIINDDIKSIISFHYDNHKKDIRDLKKELLNILDELKQNINMTNIDTKLDKHKENIVNELEAHKKEINSRIINVQKKQQFIRRI